MNANQIVNMVMRLFFRKVLSRGIDAGMDRMSRSRKGAPEDPDAAREQSKAGRDTARRAKKAMRVGRRIGRF
ncbi:hypothetical protein P1J78_11545 [Psychromarinibacter sp. C21-152]|uniref:Uncharacterized protein n=1 Tax=Psychromarinibacter sediminicola TaxID=3033385 RepID=A0AAE3NVG0_9RHOB|nr:hypothetical protein [Psychromarinibacter sediminicola]MDF0601367.1 hypothetical protein [Psychromarinibacter sediminicola]